MKKFIVFFSIFLPCNVLAFSSTTVMDMDSRRVLYSNNSYEVGLIASTSKIMTAIVAINHGKLSDVVTVSNNVLKSYGSGIYIEVGEKITLEELLYGLMLRSGNDAAIEIANYIGGSMEGFVKIMNDTANSIGLKSTNFINSSGLENEEGIGNTSTGYDMALLMSYAMDNDIFRDIVSTKEKIVKTNFKTYSWHNKNRLLNEYEYCNGGKTGFTEKARRTLVTTALKNNMRFVIVTLNDPNDFSNHKTLYEKYFKMYKNYEVLNKDEFSIEGKDYYIKNNFNYTLLPSESNKIEVNNIFYEKNISNIVGYINVMYDGKTIHKEYIYEKIKKVNKKKGILSIFMNYLKGLYG